MAFMNFSPFFVVREKLVAKSLYFYTVSKPLEAKRLFLEWQKKYNCVVSRPGVTVSKGQTKITFLPNVATDWLAFLLLSILDVIGSNLAPKTEVYRG